MNRNMTGREFTAAIERLGLTQVAAAKMLGTNPRTVRRWVSGDASIPWAIFLIFWLIEEYDVDHLEIPWRPTREEQERMDMEEGARMVSGGPVAFTRRQPPTKS